MATMEQVQFLNSALEEMKLQIATLRGENNMLMKANQGGAKRGLIDTKELSRMDSLETPKQWADWSTRFKDAVGARGHAAARFALDQVENMPEDNGGVVKCGILAQQARPEIWGEARIDESTWRMWAQDLYYILEDMTRGDATVTIRNPVDQAADEPQDGFRAWRALKVSMNPKTPARRLQCFMDVVNVSEIKDKREVNIGINTWLRKVSRLKTEFDEQLSASLRTALLISILPKDMQVAALQQVDMKEDSADEIVREQVFKDVIEKVKTVINSEIARSVPTPMEGVTVGRVAAGHEYWPDNEHLHWGSDSRADVGNLDQYEIDAVGYGLECYSCGQKGHRAFECPQKGKGKGSYKGGSKGGYDSNGKGGDHFSRGNGGYGYKGQGYQKGFGKGQWQMRRKACFGCGSLDHLQRNCPKNVGSVDETNVQNVTNNMINDEDVIFIGNVGRAKTFGEIAFVKPPRKKVRKCNRTVTPAGPLTSSVTSGRFDCLRTDSDDVEEKSIETLMKEVRMVGDQFVVEPESVDICAVGKSEETMVGLTFQATDVKKALAAVWRGCEKGNIVQFGDAPEDCFVKNKQTSRKIFMRKKKGSYVLDVEFVIKKEGELISLGKGEITVDSAAEESVCPKDWGGAFELKTQKKKMNFRAANGQAMEHYGERTITCLAETSPGSRSAPFPGPP